MFKHSNHALRAVCFILIFCLCFNCISRILQEKWVAYNSIAETYIMDQFCQLKDNSIELAVLGSSQTVSGFSCMHLLDQYKISAFSPSTSSQPMICTYYFAKQMLRTQSLKTAIIDVSMLFEKIQPAGFRRVSDLAPFSMDNLKMIFHYSKYVQKKQGTKKAVRAFWSFLFPIMQYHDRWEMLNASDFGQDACGPFVFRGNTSQIAEMAVSDILIDDQSIDPDDKPIAEQLYWFRETLNLFKEADIPVLLIKTPKYDWSRTRMLTVQSIADEYQLDYLDFNTKELFTAAGLSEEHDFSNPEHLNYYGAIKLTNYLADYLKEHFSFSTFHISPAEENDMNAFHSLLRKNDMMLTMNPATMLSCAADRDCTVLLQIDKGATLSGTLMNQLQLFGFHVTQEGINHQHYFGQYSGTSLIFEEYYDSTLDYRTELPSGQTLNLTKKADDDIKVSLNNEEISFPARGVNVLISANNYPEIVRAVSLSGTDSEICFLS